MSIQIERNNDDVVLVSAIGKLVKEDHALFAAQFEQAVSKTGKLRVLFYITEFNGWDSKGIWEEAKFDVRHNADISRLAVIGE